MAGRILDYTIGPVGRSVLVATTPGHTRRGFPGGNHQYPFAQDGESLLVEVPEADMFKTDFMLYLSPGNAMDETYERFDRGALQFIRPEHAAFPDPLPQKLTTEIHIKSSEYFVDKDSTNAQNEVQVTVMNGGDTSQYANTPYMYLDNQLQTFGRRLPMFRLPSPKGFRKPVLFKFMLDDTGPPPPPRHSLHSVPRCPSSGAAIRSDHWYDSVQIIFNQSKPGSKILTINFRFVEHANDGGAQVLPVLYDVTDFALHEAHRTLVLVKLRKARIPFPFGEMENDN